MEVTNENEKQDQNFRHDVVICAWCKQYMDPETNQIVDPPQDIAECDRFSHSICPACVVGVNAEMDEAARDLGTYVERFNLGV